MIDYPDPPTPPKCRTIQEGTKSDLVCISMIVGFFFGIIFMQLIQMCKG
jgi:hypothetical protein